jgi:methylated-DNA-protein-cysteine methyltransferase-like protein
VVAAVQRLRPGDLVTYGDIADEIGRPGSGQAVANVLRSAPGLPWWRVVPADGRLYRTHAPTQIPLLKREGHRVDDERRIR